MFQPCTVLNTDLVDNILATNMNHKFHTPVMATPNHPKGGFHQNPSGLPKPPALAQKKHISYSRRDDYILEIEQQLMQKYRVGYSGLHKMLVIKEGQQQFSRPFL